jgi:iron complex outermembrane receptor protein
VRDHAGGAGVAAAIALGATPLKPEKATNYSLGVTWDPSPAFHLAVDAYQIDIRGQLGQSSQIGYNAQDPARVTDNSGTVLSAAQKNTIDALGSAGISILPVMRSTPATSPTWAIPARAVSS